MKQLLKKSWPVIFIALFCLFIISIWFKDQKLLATGEEGLILTNPSRAVELYKYAWNEIGPGYAYPGLNTLVPFLTVENWVIQRGIPIWLFQATIFYFLMLIGSISVFALTKILLKDLIIKKSIDSIGFVAAVFYILNPISLLGVWFRFALSFEFFYAFVPLFFCLYVVGLNKRKILFTLFVPLVSLIFSYIYSAPALTALIWLLPFIYTLSLSFSFSHGVRWQWRVYPLMYFFLMFSFWILIDLWWILPYVELSKIAFASETSPAHAIGTLKANSLDFGLINVVRLIHGGFLYRGEAFGSIYKTMPFVLISWFIPLITLYGLYKLRSGYTKMFYFVSIVGLVFLVKGISPPFGGVFLWLFKQVTFMQVYRNPMEKIGMLMPVIYAPLFSFGLFVLISKISSQFLKKVFFISMMVSLVINCWPFFTGAITHFDRREIRVEVPDSFSQANKALIGDDHIIFSLPAMGGASGRYKWKSGYAGVESSEYLFNYPVIVKFYDASAFFAQLLIALSQGKMESNLVGLAQIFSADKVAYRKDTDVVAFKEHLDGLESSKKIIAKANLSKVYDSPEVSLWSLPKENTVKVIYAPQSVRVGDSPDDLILLIEDSKFDGKNETFLCVNNEKCHPYDSNIDPRLIKIEAVPENIDFTKLSPTDYDVSVKSSKGKFLLVFNNTYHPGWRVFVDNYPMRSEDHIVANGYANGFILNKKGDFHISMQFQPKQTLNKSLRISEYFIFSGLLVLLAAGIYQGFRLMG